MKWIDNIFDRLYEKCSVLYRLWRDDKRIRWASCSLLVVVSLLIIFFGRSDIGYDVKNFQQYWLKYLNKDGLFSIYNHLSDTNHKTNYPVLYYVFLFAIRPLIKCVSLYFGTYSIALISKINMLVVHCVISYFWYRKNPKISFVWFFNPFLIWIFTMTIHFDELIVFLMILCMEGIYENNCRQSVICFTIALLLKLQGLYLLPIILICSFGKNKQNWWKWIVICGFTSFMIYLPFAIKSNNLFLMFDVYLNGFSSQYNNSYISSIWYPITFIINCKILSRQLRVISFILLDMCVLWFIRSFKYNGIKLAVFEYMLLINYVTFSQDIRYVVYCLIIGMFVMITDNSVSEMKLLCKLDCIYTNCLLLCQGLLILINACQDLFFALSIVFLLIMMISWIVYCRYVAKYLYKRFEFLFLKKEVCAE